MMKIFISIYKQSFCNLPFGRFETFQTVIISLFLFFITNFCQAQIAGLQRVESDTTPALNMDALYNRPFLQATKLPIAIGGYVEANTQYAQTDGVSEDGYAFQFRRMTLFFSSTVAQKIKFMSEIEFEDGTKEINIESAITDIEFHPLLNLRAGILLNPIGGFNQNHDSPRWDFVDRPMMATGIIPTTLSNVGLGLHGKHFVNQWVMGYEAYLTNGFNDKIISNSLNRTQLNAGKSDPDKFEKSNSGLPTFSGKAAIRHRKWGEMGLSCMTGIFNKWRQDGLILDEKRRVSIVALDFNTNLFQNRLQITGEAAKVYVDVPATYTQSYGKQQFGFFLDIVGTILKQKIFNWNHAQLNIGLRSEYVDYNQGNFKETGGNIADDKWSFTPSIAFRPVGTTVIRLNYRYQKQHDLLGNPAAKTGIIQFGLATYF
jgi:hypothetical protein